MNKKYYDIEHMPMLNRPDGGINETRGVGGILARLWRTILNDKNIKPSYFELLLNEFIIKAKRRIPDNRVSKLFTRGNLRREFEKPTMTFKVFMKGLKLLNVKKVTFAVKLEYASNKEPSLHQTIIDLGDGGTTTSELYEETKDDE